MTPMNEGAVRRLAASAESAMGRRFWGFAAVGVRGKVVWSAARGTGQDAVKVCEDTLFEVSSVSKQFTAAAILKLQEEGKLALDDRLCAFFPDAPHDKSGIRVRDLLGHTSGLDPDFGLEYDSRATREQYISEVFASRLVSPAGEAFDYANINYSLLAAIVEVAAGHPFEDYLRANIFDPAGLASTGFIGEPWLIDSRWDCARMCDGEADGTAANWFWGWGYRGMGGVVASARDLFVWDRALRGDTVLADHAKRQMYEPGKGGYGLGWFVEPTGRGTQKAWHSGSVSGFEALFARYLEDDVVVVVLSNEDSDVERIGRAIEDALFDRPAMAVFFSPEHPAADAPGARLGDLEVSAETSGDIVVLTLVEGGSGASIAALSMPVGYKQLVAFDLERCIEELPREALRAKSKTRIRKNGRSATRGSGDRREVGPCQLMAVPGDEYRSRWWRRPKPLGVTLCAQTERGDTVIALDMNARAAAELAKLLTSHAAKYDALS